MIGLSVTLWRRAVIGAW